MIMFVLKSFSIIVENRLSESTLHENTILEHIHSEDSSIYMDVLNLLMRHIQSERDINNIINMCIVATIDKCSSIYLTEFDQTLTNIKVSITECDFIQLRMYVLANSRNNWLKYIYQNCIDNTFQQRDILLHIYRHAFDRIKNTVDDESIIKDYRIIRWKYFPAARKLN